MPASRAVGQRQSVSTQSSPHKFFHQRHSRLGRGGAQIEMPRQSCCVIGGMELSDALQWLTPEQERTLAPALRGSRRPDAHFSQLLRKADAHPMQRSGARTGLALPGTPIRTSAAPLPRGRRFFASRRLEMKVSGPTPLASRGGWQTRS